jgi:hypothetical protein
MISPKRNQHYHGYMVRDDARACSILLQSFAIDHASATVLRLSKEAKASMMSRLAPYDIDRAAAVVLIACVNDRILWSRYPDPAQYLEFRELRAHIRWWSRRTRDGAMVRRGAISSGFRHKATRFWMAIRMIRPDDRRASIASSGPSSSSALCVFSPPAISACNLSGGQPSSGPTLGNAGRGQLQGDRQPPIALYHDVHHIPSECLLVHLSPLRATRYCVVGDGLRRCGFTVHPIAVIAGLETFHEIDAGMACLHRVGDFGIGC